MNNKEYAMNNLYFCRRHVFSFSFFIDLYFKLNLEFDFEI